MASPVLLNNVDHRDVRVRTGHSAEFGDATNMVRVFATEYEELQREYPILIRRDDEGRFHTAALLGLDPDENLFLGADGWMKIDGEGFKAFKGDKDELIMEGKKDPGADTPPHMANFLAACRSRNYKDLHADVAIGVMSADLCHLANASYRAGRKLTVDAAKGRFTGDGAAEGNQYLTRPKYRAPYAV